jgi:hypothetical protein
MSVGQDTGIVDLRLSHTADVGILVTSIDLESGRGDLFVANSLAKGLRDRGITVTLIPPQYWYKPEILPKKILVMHPTFDASRVPSVLSRTLVAWARNNFELWLNSGKLEMYSKVFAASESGISVLKSRFGDRVHDIPARIGFNPDLFQWSDDFRDIPVSITSSDWGSGRVSRDAAVALGEFTQVHIFGTGSKVGQGSKSLYFHGLVSYKDIPGIYKRSSLVLDDLIPTNLRHGVLNSRFFDSLASGALPLTNTRAELIKLGLPQIPTWKTKKELTLLVHSLLNDPDRLKSILSEIKETIPTLATASVALPLIEFLTEAATAAGPSTSTIVFPDYRHTNEFQYLVYQSRICSASDRFLFTSKFKDLFDGRFSKEESPHLDIHWIEPIVMPGSDSQTRRRISSLVSLLRILRENGKTQVNFFLHNLRPHDLRKLGLFRLVNRILISIASSVHIMNPKSLKLLGEGGSERASVMVHPSYLGIYPDYTKRDWAQEALGLPKDKLIVGIVGALRPYKGVMELVESFAENDRAGLHLMIAGRAEPPEFRRALKNAVKSKVNISFFEGHIENNLLMRYVRALDVAVMPFKSILNSGSVKLFSDSKVPVLVPGKLLQNFDSELVRPFDSLPKALNDLGKISISRFMKMEKETSSAD